MSRSYKLRYQNILLQDVGDQEPGEFRMLEKAIGWRSLSGDKDNAKRLVLEPGECENAKFISYTDSFAIEFSYNGNVKRFAKFPKEALKDVRNFLKKFFPQTNISETTAHGKSPSASAPQTPSSHASSSASAAEEPIDPNAVIVEVDGIMFIKPKGQRLDVLFLPKMMVLRAKGVDVRILYSSITQIVKTSDYFPARAFVVVAVNSPIVLGKTTYLYLLTRFETKEKNITVRLNMPEGQTFRTSAGQALPPTLMGPSYEVFATLVSTFANRAISQPTTFRSSEGRHLVSHGCSPPYLLPLDDSVLLLDKNMAPSLALLKEISRVQFVGADWTLKGSPPQARATTSCPNLFEVQMSCNNKRELKFYPTQKEELGVLYDYFTKKKIPIVQGKASLSVSEDGRTRKFTPDDDDNEDDDDEDSDYEDTDEEAEDEGGSDDGDEDDSGGGIGDTDDEGQGKEPAASLHKDKRKAKDRVNARVEGQVVQGKGKGKRREEVGKLGENVKVGGKSKGEGGSRDRGEKRPLTNGKSHSVSKKPKGPGPGQGAEGSGTP